MPQERLTKDQKREQAREAARLAREARVKAQARNRILIRVGATVGVLALLGAIGGGIWLATRPAGPGPVNMASDGILLTGSDGEITAVETPAIPGDGTPTAVDPADYPGTTHVVTYIDYGCPFCGQFETTNGETLRSLLESGDIILEVHPISILDNRFMGSAYPTRAANAASCVAAGAPDAFFDVNAALFASQPTEGTEGLSDDELVDIVAGAGVDDPDIASCIRDGRYEGWVQEATTRALAGPLPNTDVENVTGTPLVLVNGVRYQGSLSDPNAFATFLLTNATPSDDAPADEPAPSPTPTP